MIIKCSADSEGVRLLRLALHRGMDDDLFGTNSRQKPGRARYLVDVWQFSSLTELLNRRVLTHCTRTRIHMLRTVARPSCPSFFRNVRISMYLVRCIPIASSMRYGAEDECNQNLIKGAIRIQ
ncbi:hypothetical protein AcV5_009459 [Taiwanofungus camphoratus]|nr:hypothetical protein AcV5_009459 [Antrodia cinnamomea]KAI0943172.1 hypothetical protein AcV7_002395 [Antrodia cinnamomea]